MKKIKREAKSLIDESLFTLAEKCAAARPLGAFITGRWHPPPIKKRFSRSRNIQKSLLPEHLGPNGLVALITIAIERVVPARACINIFAALRIPSIIQLRTRPPVRN